MLKGSAGYQVLFMFCLLILFYVYPRCGVHCVNLAIWLQYVNKLTYLLNDNKLWCQAQQIEPVFVRNLRYSIISSIFVVLSCARARRRLSVVRHMPVFVKTDGRRITWFSLSVLVPTSVDIYDIGLWTPLARVSNKTKLAKNGEETGDYWPINCYI